jgi:type I restriction enzyme S subunit
MISGSAQPQITRADVEKFEVRLPEEAEQLALSTLFDELQHEISCREAELVALKQEKSALMQQLLTGKRRVNLGQREAA